MKEPRPTPHPALSRRERFDHWCACGHANISPDSYVGGASRNPRVLCPDLRAVNPLPPGIGARLSYIDGRPDPVWAYEETTASGFMLASHRNPHPQSLRPGRGGGVMPLSCRSRLGVEVPPPLPGRVSGALVRWVREHEPARFPPAIRHCPFGAWHDAPRSRRTTFAMRVCLTERICHRTHRMGY